MFYFFITEKKIPHILHYMYNKNIPQLQNQYLNVLFFITNKEKEKVES